jgi:hypothetical protein
MDFLSPINGTLIAAGAGANLPAVGNIRGSRLSETVRGHLVVAGNSLGPETVQVTAFVTQEYTPAKKLFQQYMVERYVGKRSKFRDLINTMLDTGTFNNPDDYEDLLDLIKLLHHIVKQLNKDEMVKIVPKRKLTGLLDGGWLKGLEDAYGGLQELTNPYRVEPEKEKTKVDCEKGKKRNFVEPEKVKTPKRMREEDLPTEEEIDAMTSDVSWDGIDGIKDPEFAEGQRSSDVEIAKSSSPTGTFKFTEVPIEDVDSDPEDFDVPGSLKKTRNNMKPGESFVSGPVNKNRPNEFMGCGAEPHTTTTASEKGLKASAKHLKEYGWRRGPGTMGIQTLTRVSASDIEKGTPRLEHPDGNGKFVIWKYANTQTDADVRYKLYFTMALKMHQRNKMPEVVWDTRKKPKAMDVEKASIEYARDNSDLFIKTLIEECKVCSSLLLKLIPIYINPIT